jgi:membrane protein required for beta-lactamase induction
MDIHPTFYSGWFKSLLQVIGMLIVCFLATILFLSIVVGTLMALISLLPK